MSADEGGDAVLVPATNGEHRPSPPDSTAVATPGKRKRSSQDEKSAQESGLSAPQDRQDLHETLQTLVDLLLKHDSELQLLSCPFAASTSKPRTKRAKTSNDQELSSIQSRVNSSRYSTLQEFLADIEKASAAVIERNQNQANGTKPDGPPLTEVVNRIAAFKKHMNTLVGQSFVNQVDVKAEASDDDSEAPVWSTVSNMGAREDKQALTLFGNPSNPRHLFSSLQKSTKVPLLSSESEAEKFVEVQEPLRETALPSGITSTKVVPYNLEADHKSPKLTFGDVFAPRQGLPQLEPPRRRRSRSMSSTWIDPFDAILDTRSFLGERNNYCLSSLPSGQWLQYGGVTSSPSCWGRLEKHGDGDVGPRRHGDFTLWTDDDSSLLQGVYSSFAPSFDSSGAVIEADLKDMVWWSKRGSKRLRTLLSLPYMEGVKDQGNSTVQPGNIGELDESTLDEMVANFNPNDFAENVGENDVENKEEPESKDVEEMLGDISELLDTLSSYQKVRNLTLPSDGDQETESKESPEPDFGTPRTPSSAESAIYDTLKSSLAALISNLPPYAVAKLDGDQLAELNISQTILIENPNYSGTMDKDDYTLQQERAAAMAASAANAPNRTSTPSSVRSSSLQGSHGGYNQRAYVSNARVSQGGFQVPPQHARQSSAGVYTPQAYGGVRPPSTNTPSQRPGYLQQYSQMTPQYSQANNVPQFQRAGPNGYTPYSAQQGQSSAQASPQPYTPRPGQPAPYNQKQPSYSTPQTRTPYANAGAANPAQQRYQQQNYANSAAAATYARSAAEQAALMDRNKAQLAAQQTRQSPSTPQTLGQSISPERSVTPASKQNGTPVPS
ncbi:hypothetical protein N7474_009604 [Penicillium riverlandense]|uniref:uncharacterized protein n=1 Tax=Penicillium riverlandense TaxID=1903569 RepID=UPI002548B15F|nr:uncharacterized protein N7474_009604 [Penicillium riverlandense]KAJ5808335.1 hypothetical protein N7474_009604 [Penicillium riverlandense]